jgi:magnesium transporter
MLHVLQSGTNAYAPETVGPDWRLPADAVWVDLIEPTREEEVAVERALGVDLPTLQEMEALEPSSRLYQEGGATFMTGTLLGRSGSDMPQETPVTFVLVRGLLVTLRYTELRAFTVFAQRAPGGEVATGTAAFLGLMDAIIERLGQILDGAGRQVDTVSGDIFRRPSGGDFQPLLTGLAQAQSLTALTRTSFVSLARLLSYAGLASEIAGDPECKAHLESLQRDAQSLTEHAAYRSSHISFLLDAALGLINIEQNGIIKFFSVVAVVFLPPTLVASIYGMNFKFMPELNWPWGYPLALAAMLASAVLPWLWFKRKGWF